MINLTIHNKCNQFCVFCNTQRLLLDKVWKETTKEDILKQIQDAAKKNDVVSFTGGGEVTMLKDLPGLIRYAKSLGIKEVHIETNAVLLAYPDYTRKLKDSGLDYCIVSLHSHKEEISDFLTQKKGSFRYTIKGLSNLIKENIPIKTVFHTITKFNYKDLKQFIIFMRNDFGINSFGLSFIRPIQLFEKSIKSTPSLTEIESYLHEALDFCNENLIKATISPGLGVPLCFLRGYEEYSQEFLIYLNRGKSQHEEQSYASEKIKDLKCKKCSMKFCCGGIHRNYADIYGTNELKPINQNPKELIKKCKKNTS